MTLLFDYKTLRVKNKYFGCFNSINNICDCKYHFSFFTDCNQKTVKYNIKHYNDNHHRTFCDCGKYITSKSHYNSKHHINFIKYHYNNINNIFDDNEYSKICECGVTYVHYHNKTSEEHMKYVKWVKDRSEIRKYINNTFIYGIGNIINEYIRYIDEIKI